MDEIWKLFPNDISKAMIAETTASNQPLEEIRLRTNSCIELVFINRIVWLENTTFTENDSIYVLNQLSEHSLYRMQQELREGYMTTRGGHRVGLAGAVTTESGNMKQLQHITFFNIRIAKEVKNVAESIIPLLKEGGNLRNTLLIGAPQSGKTTVLRDLARLISNGNAGSPGRKVGVVDERSEIAAAYKGIPQHDTGIRTDVMDACPKAEGLMMMIRSMSPEVLISDEIGSLRDVQALLEAVASGVTIICTVHGDSISSVRRRPSLEKLFTSNMFERFIILKRDKNKNFFLQVLDENSMILYDGEALEI